MAVQTATTTIAKGTRISRWALGVLGTAFVLLAVALFVVEAGETQGAATSVSYGGGVRPNVGEKAPDFTAPDLSGNLVRLSDYQGRPVWINFWGSWCPPCRAEMPEIDAAYREAQSSGLVLLAVSVGEDRDVVARYLRQTGFDIPAVLDADGLVATQYAVTGFPTHVFVDRDGIVRDIRVGGLNLRSIRDRLATIVAQ